MRIVALSIFLSLFVIQPTFAADDIVAVLTGDWNDDEKQDAVMLVAPKTDEEDSTLRIYLAEGPGKLELKVNVPNFVWGAWTMYGQMPGLKALPRGSFAVTSGNSAIGRNRWEQAITIAYRDGQFLVAGYTYNDYDTLDPNNTTNCDLNLLSGRGVVDDKPVRFPSRRTPVADWKSETGYNICDAN